MKTLKLFAIASLTFLAGTINAQSNYTLPSGSYDASLATNDYVTVGSRMPYYVKPDSAIDDLITVGAMNKSLFNWTITDNADAPVTITPKDYVGTGALNLPVAPAGNGVYAQENEISVVWDAAKVTPGATPYKVKVNEHGVPATGIFADACAASNTVTRLIYVLNRPTITYTDTVVSLACGAIPGAALNYNVPLKVTGIGPWIVKYDVTYNGNPYLTAQTDTVGSTQAGIIDANVYTTATTASTPTFSIPLNGLTAASGYGVYKVTVTNITDKISSKSLDVINSVASDLATVSHDVYVVPTPVTRPIQHKAN
jgi:hypothetical protein